MDSSPAAPRSVGDRLGVPRPGVAPTVGGVAGAARGARPVSTPGSGHAGGPALRRWLRVSGTLLPHPHTLHGSKVKIKRITMRARLARGIRDSTSPQLRRPGGTPRAFPRAPPPPTSCPRRKGTKAPQSQAQVAGSPGRVQTPFCQGREGGHYGLQRKSPILKATPVEPLQWVVLHARPTSKPLAQSFLSFIF